MLVFGLAVFADVAFATTPVVKVTSPTNGSQDGSPVDFKASASSPDCSTGIAAMRIYTAPGNGVYTADSSTLDVNLPMAPGTYNTVVQAWDNCGGVGKTPVNITVTGNTLPPPRFLYSSDYAGGLIEEYDIDPGTGEITPYSQGSVSTGSKPEALATDKGGFRLYAVSQSPNQPASRFHLSEIRPRVARTPLHLLKVDSIWSCRDGGTQTSRSMTSMPVPEPSPMHRVPRSLCLRSKLEPHLDCNRSP